ncbi:MAG: hypothetical protein VYA34_02580 [Myxococcota bacterium]|nr:hypothetical protein [Myxococcota bacterium]
MVLRTHQTKTEPSLWLSLFYLGFINLVFLLLSASCNTDADTANCSELFGKPNDSTGLDNSACSPTCRCHREPWIAPAYTAEVVEKFKVKKLSNPFPNLGQDPYADPNFAAYPTDGFCGVLYEDDERLTYSLKTYTSESDAQLAGAFITHGGACGLCSTLTDLAVYIANPDLTGPVRTCGFKGILESPEANLACLTEIGFTLPCAQIWYYNTTNTRKECEVCFDLLNAAYNQKDGSLNACLQCDEDQSGPIFKAVSARTRRNSGLPTAICRPCIGVYPLVHDYL